MKGTFRSLIKLLLFPYRDLKTKAIRLAYIRRQKLAWKDLSQAKCIMLELGSGFKKGVNGWTTVDLEGADICCDLRDGIRLTNDSVDQIYSSHLLEHIPFNGLINFINECKRVLKPNGVFSVCVPNARLYIQAYVNGRKFRPDDALWVPAVVNTDSLIDQVNYIAYMGGHHHHLFDQESLIGLLKKAGFSDVKLRNFDPSIDISERDFESIYALAIK